MTRFSLVLLLVVTGKGREDRDLTLLAHPDPAVASQQQVYDLRPRRSF